METQNKKKTILVGLQKEELRNLMGAIGEPAFRGDQLYKWIYNKQVDTFEHMSNLPRALRQMLQEQFQLSTLTLLAREISADGTEKYLWQLSDGHRVESVLIPEERRTTLCISSQVGCALDCAFCATGKMGFLRHLTTGEIVEQVLAAQRLSQHKITNVVFMGMGEPFLNYKRVIAAAQILGDPEGVAIAHRRITISTSGIVPAIRQFAREKHPYGLAISLHSPFQPIREQIMPIAQKFALRELLDSAREYTQQWRHKRITFEYVLLKGVNDRPEDARELIRLLSPLRAKLNLIPYNDCDLGFEAPDESRLNRFLEPLMRAPFTVTVRKNRGNDISAACGQLYVKVSQEESVRQTRKIKIKQKMIS